MTLREIDAAIEGEQQRLAELREMVPSDANARAGAAAVEKRLRELRAQRDHGGNGLTAADLEALAAGFGPVIQQYVQQEIATAIGPLLARLASLEARPEVIDRGVWRAGNYARGSAVSFDGSLWIAQNDTEARPGTNSEWRLAVKRGRDGKDAR